MGPSFESLLRYGLRVREIKRVTKDSSLDQRNLVKHNPKKFVLYLLNRSRVTELSPYAVSSWAYMQKYQRTSCRSFEIDP